VSEVILAHANEFAERALLPVFEMSNKPVYVPGDAEKLRRIVENLITNCLKYASGDVTFTVAQTDPVCLTVENPADNLAGIDPGRLFERFYRDVSRSGQGTGLGLPIAQLLAQSMGGTLAASVEGDRFSVRLCLPAYEGSDDAQAPSLLYDHSRAVPI